MLKKNRIIGYFLVFAMDNMLVLLFDTRFPHVPVRLFWNIGLDRVGKGSASPPPTAAQYYRTVRIFADSAGFALTNVGYLGISEVLME